MEIEYVRKEDVLMQLHGNVDMIVQRKTPLKLEDVSMIERDCEREITQFILMEGAPGVGKTTMAWHLCSRWAERELLSHW